jgi:hypothetical protein
MSDTQGSSSNGERDAEDLDGVPEADASSADGTAPAVDFGDAPKAEADVTPEAAAESPADPTVEADAPLDEAPSAFLADDPAAANEVDYEALAAELDRLEAETAAAAPVSPSQPEPEPSQAEEPVTKADPWFEPAKTEVFAAAAVPVEEPAAAPAPATVVEETVPPAPIFVQAPELPRKRGNRGATGLIGLVAALVFAALYGAALYGWQVFVSLVPAMNISPVLDPMDFIGDVLLSGPYWVTVVAFWLAFWLLGVFVNRARWWSWVVLGFFVALLTYAGFLGGVFFEAPFWKITGSQAADLLRSTAFAPVGLFAFIIAREVTIWFGGWASGRGAKVTAQNKEARDEYERVMAEGPAASA